MVCAADAELLEAVDVVWEGEPSVSVSPLDLARQLRELLLEEGFAGDELFFRAASRALEGRARWQAFLELPAPRRLRRLEDWLGGHAEQVEWQLEHDRDAAGTAAALEEKLSLLNQRLAPRRGNLRNRRRTNRLLMLAQLDLKTLVAGQAGHAPVLAVPDRLTPQPVGHVGPALEPNVHQHLALRVERSDRANQATVGAQIGGQSYAEVLVFESKPAMDRFKRNEFTFAAQARAYEQLFAELLPHWGHRPATAACATGEESLVR